MVIEESTRQALLLICLGLLFLIVGGYFGIIEKRIGLSNLAPVTGDLARLWGMILCLIGLFLIFLALT